ncbi:MAG: ATP-dependent Clp protease adaptor ClpS [Deltaproteobacteria bacterium]|nr:ATP-dependent Clp protease adaptor ClpS [Deltaproteobacteria bacterium]MBN2673551.1 ATP-dependent Clp protease adaptor ClpS [Deltaproteobacteria bacterium]
MPNNQEKYDSDILEADDIDSDSPGKYKVVMHNDHYTTMEFVVAVLKEIFGHTDTTAEKLMLDIHQKGEAIAGTYWFEIAETKAMQTMTRARNEGYPLKCTLRAES